MSKAKPLNPNSFAFKVSRDAAIEIGIRINTLKKNRNQGNFYPEHRVKPGPKPPLKFKLCPVCNQTEIRMFETRCDECQRKINELKYLHGLSK